MEQKKRIPLYYNNNIQRNLFPKTHSFIEKKKYSANKKQNNNNYDQDKTKQKFLKSFIYFHKIAPTVPMAPIVQIENKKEKENMIKTKISIDSRTEARLPKGYIDLSYDNPKNE